MGGLHGAKACGQELTSDGKEETGNFILEFIPHKYLNAKGRAAHPLSVPAVVTVGFYFSTTYTDNNNGVGKRMTNSSIMATIKLDFCTREKQL